VQLITIGLLPPAVRHAYGFEWTNGDARALARWTTALTLLRRVMPAFAREWPAARNGRRGESITPDGWEMVNGRRQMRATPSEGE